MTNFERFWLNIRFRGQSIAEKYADATPQRRRALAGRAFEMWRLGKLDIDYERNELTSSRGGVEVADTQGAATNRVAVAQG